MMVNRPWLSIDLYPTPSLAQILDSNLEKVTPQEIVAGEEKEEKEEKEKDDNDDLGIEVHVNEEDTLSQEVSLVAILDADKEGFLRSERSLTQTRGLFILSILLTPNEVL
ncbi:hypothetical protein N9Y26_01305 [bacterium]|nr:hypothetical protein [bacterium]